MSEQQQDEKLRKVKPRTAPAIAREGGSFTAGENGTLVKETPAPATPAATTETESAAPTNGSKSKAKARGEAASDTPTE